MFFVTLGSLSRFLHALSLFAIAIMAAGTIGYTGYCVAGLAPWLTLPLTFGDTAVPQAGQYIQLGVTAFTAAMLFFLPTNARIVALEHSHRTFQISMEDVARAYHLCHTADRAGVFTLSSEFDAVRERLAFLRDHPQLDALEPEVMEVAAQMSQQSRELADIYSEARVARAKHFLQDRQAEVERQQEKIVEALHACSQIRTWAQQIDAEEAVIARQLDQLDQILQEALPVLGYSLEQDDAVADTAPSGTRNGASDPVPSNIVPLPQKPLAAE